uniref:Cell division control protein 73 C-terminal domain-containing protein n=1 Tax=Bartheletia paradoxa TaxID=669517 RepID=A0A2D0XHT7_9BASI|nr:hypothetical protein SPAR01680 [Bartheletia paradoxa]
MESAPLQDALLALRHAFMASLPISPMLSSVPCPFSSSTHLLIPTPSGDISFPRTTPTRLKRSTGDPYALDALYFAVTNRDASARDYMHEVTGTGITGFVSVLDRRNVVEFMTGAKETHRDLVPLEGADQLSSTSVSALEVPSDTHAASKRGYEVDKADQEAVKRIRLAEIEVRSHLSALRGNKPANFSSVRGIVGDRLHRARAAQSQNPSSAAGAGGASLPSILAGKKVGKVRNNQPILLISSSPISLVTMWNVKLFLEGAIFEPSLTARQRAAEEGNVHADDVVVINRRKEGMEGEQARTRRYFVLDNAETLVKKFGEDAWDRVVCVMTTGQVWQFKTYKWKEPEKLFHHVMGVHFQWTNEPANTKIQDWNVMQLKVDPSKRHIDKSTVVHFWRALDRWMEINRPNLIA